MSHFYKQNKDGTWHLSKSIDGIAKARKSPHTYAKSVTTMLSLAPNPFMSQWRERELIKLARSNPSDDYETLSAKAWGLRECPETGELITSSDWGTRMHYAIETRNRDIIQGDGTATPKECVPFEPWVDLWVAWLEYYNVEVLEAEIMVGCAERKLAGTLDMLGRKDGRIIICDYKSRSVGDGDIKTKCYDKDKQQLAIEAQMIKEQYNLGYNPRCYSIIFNTDKPEMFAKLHTEKAQAKALRQAENLNTAWNLIHEL